jgi:antitoxin component of RelBE/YafQ-DinJ toxin-antitoxin module
MRDDQIVAARVPVEIRERGNAILASLGSTPTQLINAAYLYVLEHKRLPVETVIPSSGKRVLDPLRQQQIAAELEALQVCRYDYSAGGDKTFKQAFTEKIKQGFEPQR